MNISWKVNNSHTTISQTIDIRYGKVLVEANNLHRNGEENRYIWKLRGTGASGEREGWGEWVREYGVIQSKFSKIGGVVWKPNTLEAC